jgi:hypothetical protein
MLPQGGRSAGAAWKLCGMSMEPCLRKCGCLSLAVHQMHTSGAVACLRLGCGALGSEPNTPFILHTTQHMACCRYLKQVLIYIGKQAVTKLGADLIGNLLYPLLLWCAILTVDHYTYGHTTIKTNFRSAFFFLGAIQKVARSYKMHF